MTNNYTIIVSDGTQTLSQIASKYSANINDIINENTQAINHYDLPSTFKITDYPSAREYLRDCMLHNLKPISGFEIKIPVKVTGGNILTTREYYNYSEQAAIANSALGSWGVRSADHSDLAGRGSITARTSGLLKKFKCSYSILADGVAQVTRYLPCYPNEVSDENSASFSATEMFGRSVAYQVYNTSGRNVSVSLVLHEELVPDNYNYVRQVVKDLQSVCYPEYANSTVLPPEIILVLGSQLSVRGIVSSVGADWKAPIIDDRLVTCDVSLSITETKGPYSQSEIRSMGGYR